MTIERCILDRAGYLTIFLCIIVFMNDRYRTHSTTIFVTSAPLQGNSGIRTEEENSIYRQRMLRMKLFESFITRRKVVCEGVLYFAIIVLVAVSLLNIVERSVMVLFLLKFLLFWFIAVYCFSFFYNLQRLQKRIPQNIVQLLGT